MEAFSNSQPFPPSLAGLPMLNMLVTAGLLFGTLLSLQWLYTVIVTEMLEDPQPLRHPLTAARVIKMLFIIAALILTVPRLVMVMAWVQLSPEWRQSIALVSWLVYGLWAAVFTLAWWIDHFANPTMRYQLRRVPTPDVSAGLQANKTKGALIFTLIFVVAFATTYVRRAPHDAEPLVFQRP